MDGPEATRVIQAKLGLSHWPNFALSAGVMPEESQAAIDAGMNDFMSKPIELSKLINQKMGNPPALPGRQQST